MEKNEIIKNRYDISIWFDVKNGNPNGDPNGTNEPRMDTETSHGIVSDVCLKRKIRHAVSCIKNGSPSYKIFTTTWDVINNGIEEAKEKSPDSWVKYICDTYYDIRSFGGVLSTGNEEMNPADDNDDTTAKNKTKKKRGGKDGAVRGPVQVSMATSVDVINPMEITITRDCVTNEKDKHKERTMGTKFIVPYALYNGIITISPFEANRKDSGVTGFSESDFELLIQSLGKMFELDRSSSRGIMAMRKIVIFKHESPLGNHPSHKLFDMVSFQKKSEVEVPRNITDYNFISNLQSIPGVTVSVID